MNSKEFTVRIGILTRKTFKTWLKNLASKNNVEIKIKEERGAIFSSMKIKMTGNPKDLEYVEKRVRHAANS